MRAVDPAIVSQVRETGSHPAKAAMATAEAARILNMIRVSEETTEPMRPQGPQPLSAARIVPKPPPPPRHPETAKAAPPPLPADAIPQNRAHPHRHSTDRNPSMIPTILESSLPRDDGRWRLTHILSHQCRPTVAASIVWSFTLLHSALDLRGVPLTQYGSLAHSRTHRHAMRLNTLFGVAGLRATPAQRTHSIGWSLGECFQAANNDEMATLYPKLQAAPST